MDLLDNSGKLKSWHVFKTEYDLNQKFHFPWLQLTNAMPKAWKNTVQNNINNNSSLTIKDHQIIRRTRIVSINKLTARELYSTLISYIEKMLPNKPIKWDEIYLLPRKVTYNTYLRCFQYKVLNNMLYLNNKLYTSKSTNAPLCSFCKLESETTLYIFTLAIQLADFGHNLSYFWNQLDISLSATTNYHFWFS